MNTNINFVVANECRVHHIQCTLVDNNHEYDVRPILPQIAHHFEFHSQYKMKTRCHLQQNDLTGKLHKS